jgi:hypothetical protein
MNPGRISALRSSIDSAGTGWHCRKKKARASLEFFELWSKTATAHECSMRPQPLVSIHGASSPAVWQ